MTHVCAEFAEFQIGISLFSFFSTFFIFKCLIYALNCHSRDASLFALNSGLVHRFWMLIERANCPHFAGDVYDGNNNNNNCGKNKHNFGYKNCRNRNRNWSKWNYCRFRRWFIQSENMRLSVGTLVKLIC